MLEHQLKRVSSRLLAELRIERDVAADERLQRGAEGADDAARSDDNAPHDAEVRDGAISGHIEGSGHKAGIDSGHGLTPRDDDTAASRQQFERVHPVLTQESGN